MKMLKGTAASPGIAIGKAFVYKRRGVMVRAHKITDVDEELKRFKKALETSKMQLREVKDKAVREVGESEAKIFQAHLLILEDPRLISEVTKSIEKEKVNAEAAVQGVIKRYITIFETMKNDYFETRAADIRDVRDRILHNLLGIDPDPLTGLESRVIIIARDLTPSDAAQMDKELTLGFATDSGGLTSHTAIMARSLGIPAVVGLDNVTKNVKSEDNLILDGTNGIVIVDPSNIAIARYEKEKMEYEAYRDELEKIKHYAAETPDGRKVEITANVGSLEEIAIAISSSAEGIGLFRTEFSYLNRDSLPTEEELLKVYKKVVERMEGKPVTIRTLDLGGDKYLPYLKMPKEANPFLGWRGIRISLDNTELFKTQLHAILRASAFGNLKIMFPMVTSVEEVQAAKKLLEETKEELKTQDIPHEKNIKVGIMIETPSAAVSSDLLTREVDFFSIGTNDLIQYSLAADRTNEKVIHLYEPLHPTVLRLIKNVIDNAHKANIRVGMCGEMAGEPLYTPILIGLGLDEFSMNPFSVIKIKKIIRSVSYAKAKKIAKKALSFKTAKETREFAKDTLFKLLK